MFSTHQHPPPPIPPSPTLSNPDMILPFDDNERENSTPSPPFNLPSLSNLQSFYETRTDNYSNGHALSPAQNTNAPRAAQKKVYPRHTWTHEGHDAASRRLSDIGEEDYTSPLRHGGMVRTSQVMSQHGSTRGPPSSPLRTENPDLAETRTHSSSSGSTISGASEASSLDGSKGGCTDYVTSQESRGAKGDPGRSNGAQTANAPATNEEGPGEDMSSVILESEAERILENAKKRLSLMEGNLTRARSSMRANTPSLSPSPAPSASSAGLGQPVGGLYQSISRVADRRSIRPRQTYTTQDASNNRHSRVYSETNIPSNQPNVETNLSRSVSAMGSSSSSFYTDERSFHYAPTRSYLTHRASISSMQHPGDFVEERTSSDSPQEIEFPEEEQKISNIEDFNTVYPVLDPPSRSQSQLQVRDLQDQMKGLHIKISTLKVKAQEDNLRRRSLQSLRTPSPLTAANHWYANPLDPTEGNSNLHPSAGYGYIESPRSSQGDRSSSNTDSTLLVPGTIPEPNSSSEDAILPPFELTDHEDGQSTAESLYEDAEEGSYAGSSSPDSDIDREALEEILREPLDEDLALEAFPAVPSFTDDTPHEEREDAFDYEHFILHSALGNYTQARMRRQSNVSDTSVETTRPIRERRSVQHSRSNSANSLSTVATFATAAEGRDDIESVLYWDRKFNDELNHQYVEEDEQPEMQRPDSETLHTPRKSRLDDLASERPDSAATGSATPTSLASSLVSTVRAAASPYPMNSNLGINEDDTRLLEQLFKSLGDVCMELQELTTSPDYDDKQAKLLRRRLEAARRVLDGELD
ncbi:hypothetical protein BDW59DRAFT_139780 [Aspergillus cavernicola]|uniref:BAG domain-containing protein n=1 Tax=Aspergillus cavernicola TaxID=176166 RepID=A0ABR4IWJ3_9EURO